MRPPEHRTTVRREQGRFPGTSTSPIREASPLLDRLSGHRPGSLCAHTRTSDAVATVRGRHDSEDDAGDTVCAANVPVPQKTRKEDTLRHLARSVTPRAAGVLFLLAAVTAIVAATTASAAPGPPNPPAKHIGGVVPLGRPSGPGLRRPDLPRRARDDHQQDVRDLLAALRLHHALRLPVDDQPVLHRRRARRQHVFERLRGGHAVLVDPVQLGVRRLDGRHERVPVERLLGLLGRDEVPDRCAAPDRDPERDLVPGLDEERHEHVLLVHAAGHRQLFRLERQRVRVHPVLRLPRHDELGRRDLRQPAVRSRERLLDR